MFDISTYKTAMNNTLEHLRSEFKKLRTGRAHPDILSGIKVELYGQSMPINHVANITADATMLLVTPFDPSSISQISAAIRNDASLGLNPADDGRLIRVPIPPLTEERRREIVKLASSKVEESKINLRNIREDARKTIKTLDLPEDASRKAEKEIDDLTRDFGTKLDSELKSKETEIMKI